MPTHSFLSLAAYLDQFCFSVSCAVVSSTRFTPNPGSWFAHQHDEYGTGVEVYPAGTELRPAGPEGAGFAMTEPIRPGYSPTHFALSVPISQEMITAIAEREGWQCHCCERGAGE
jgi:hypothetical protein